MNLGGPRYESLRNENQENSNDPSGLSPDAAAGSAWSSLARRESDQSAMDEFELAQFNDRTGLATGRPSQRPRGESQEDLITGGDPVFNTHLHSSKPSTASSHLASMKQVLGRASTRVMNISGSSQSRPLSSAYSRRSMEESEQEREARASLVSPAEESQDPARISRSSPSLNPEMIYDQHLPADPVLQGKSLFIFGPDSQFRQTISHFLNQAWIELFLLFLLVLNLVFLVVMISSPAGNDTVWGAHWTDYGLLAIFVLYTIEISLRVIDSGLVLYAEDGDKIRKAFGKKQRTDNLHDTNPTILRKTNPTMLPSATFRQTEQTIPVHNATTGRATTIIDFAVGRQTYVSQLLPTYMDQLVEYRPQFIAVKAQIPFLRHTFNRIDMLAVSCYWIDFILMMLGVQHIYFFKTIAAMRTLRLLNITSGSSTILQSLKKSAPLLVNIALFIAFFFFIFSIIGVQAFKGSLSRHCVLGTNNTEVLLDQFCGGHYNISDPSGKSSYITIDGINSPTSPKGHICSAAYICLDTGVNFDGAVSFDVIYSAMVPVYVLMTSQTWTDMMYRIMDAEYSWSSIYFVIVVLVMNFWILNLFVAVINEMFAKIRDDSGNNSAFKSDATEIKPEILNDSINNFTFNPNNTSNNRKQWVDNLELFWVIAVVADLVFQSMPRFNSQPDVVQKYDRVEFWFSVAFGVDIALRFLVCLPKPQEFFQSKKNLVDLFLAVVTLIIQIPPIHNSHVYVYLTVFQVVRVYRPIIYVERLRSLIQRVVGSWVGLLNLVLFIALFLVVVSVMAGILFREVVDPTTTNMNFSDFYVSYLAMYQLFSGENWTDILYNVMTAEIPWGQVVVATVFVIAFYSFANFVLVNMLIAIIMENFDGEAEIAKHAQQIQDFAEKSGYSKEQERKYKIYLQQYLKPYPKSIGVDIMQSGWLHSKRKGLAREFLLRDFALFHGVEKDPLKELSKKQRRRVSSQYSDHFFAPRYGPADGDDVDDTEHFRKLYAAPEPGYEDIQSVNETTTKSRRFFSLEAFRHRSLLIFGPENRFRRYLQRFVNPGLGYRVEGDPENPMLSRPFNMFITLAIIACVIVAAITTPAWRLHQYMLNPDGRSILIRISDLVFPAIFTVEFLIRVIADGFILTPDAYLKTLWNQIDFLVLLSLYAPLIANLTNSQGSSRFFRSLKALRALRLVNQSAYIKGTFHAVLVAGFPQLFDATMLCMALLVPFAIYGMRLFSGLFFSCNDGSNSIQSIGDCTGTFMDPDNQLVMPRVWANPHVYSFDNFGASFLILFEIVSQEGWIGVMETARNIVGLGLQSNTDASRYNGIFFVLFNLAGGIFVTSLFVAIVIENYTKRTGTAFMTANQRRWMDLKKLLGGIKMSKAYMSPPANPIRAMCYRIASPKRGWFVRLLTVITVLNGILLATEHVNSGDWEGVKNYVFLALLMFYMVEIFVKIFGLGWHAYRKSWWNIYNATVSIMALIITVARIGGSSWQPLIQTQKLLLTAILFRIVPRIDSLNQLFMTMAASIGSIASLLGVWLVVFAVFGIMFVEIFGLTSYGPNGGDHVNFRNIGTSLLMMARMSTGEGWNDLMHDFAVEKPNCVNEPNNYLLSDCGSTAWAYSLFIMFNIISMYIFTNMFIVVVMHNFSYVYQIAPGFSLINREEIRGFKRIWAEIDTGRTGYIEEKDLTRFLMKLRGVFNMRIYNEEHSLAKLKSKLETPKPSSVQLSARELEKKAATGTDTKRRILMLNETNRRSTFNMDDAQKEKSTSSGNGGINAPRTPLSPPTSLEDYNLAAFNSAMANIDQAEVRRRRKVYNFLYAEAVMSMEPIPGREPRRRGRLFQHLRSLSGGSHHGVNNGSGVGPSTSGDYEMGEVGDEKIEAPRGISFQKMLTILAHYKLIEDDQCLSIRDMLRHRQKMDRLHAQVNVMNVKSILLRMMLRQRFVRPEGSFGSGVGVGGLGGASVQQIPTIEHSQSATSPGSPTTTAAGALAVTASATSVRSLLSFLSEADQRALERGEPIDPERANLMIHDLRSEWRSFISTHDLMMVGSVQASAQELDNEEMRVMNDFEKSESNTQSSGVVAASDQQQQQQQQQQFQTPKEVWGLDYL
ncbi:calcium channel protein [Dissophora ornata]|nr:calcium channel protein [Dissophora ornata]